MSDNDFQALDQLAGLESALGPSGGEPPKPEETPAVPAVKAVAEAAATAVAVQASRAAQLARERFNTLSGPMSQGLGALVDGLSDSDRTTRRMSTLFFVCSLGAIVVSAAALYRLKPKGASDAVAALAAESAEVGDHLGEFLTKQTEEARRKAVMFGLGEFTVALKRGPNDVPVKGVANLAELDLYVECDTKDTCAYIESNSVQARNLITNALIDVDRELLLTREGKRKLKKAVIDRMNSWLPRGKIENLYFARLIIG